MLAALICVGAFSASAQVPQPYFPDAGTLHMWHLNEGAAPVMDFAPGAIPLAALGNGATLTNDSFANFGTALSTQDGGAAGGNVAQAIDAYLAPVTLVNGSADNVAWSFDNSASGAFTFEALIRIDFDPMANLGSSGTGRNLPMQILSGDQESIGTRSWQFRLDPAGFNPNADGVFAALSAPALEFININGGVSVQNFVVPIPTNGVHAIASNRWYHVAVTYTGDEAAPDNLRFFWTLLETNRTAASLLAPRQMTSNLNDSDTVDLCLGNTGRTTPNNNFIGLLDEVRVSSVARGSNEFVFRSSVVLEASATPETNNPPASAMDGNLNTRWSANGDGQWITFDLGRAELVESVAIAFFQGNVRTTTFDVLLSRDNSTWTTALAGVTSSGTNLNLETHDLPDQAARFVRIVGHGNSSGNGWNSITEVSITRLPLTDTDVDGLPDVWENLHFTNLLQNATGDPDADTLSNLYEYMHSLDPNLASGIAEDSDGDGLADNWEQLWFGSLNETAESDPDRDGLANLGELQHGTDPTNPNSVVGDLDGDGLPDAWELSALGSLAHWAFEDADGDGCNQMAEMVAGTSPTNAASRPSWVSPRVAFLKDSVVVTNACLMPNGSTYGRAINGVAFQNQPLLFNGYQYIAWYDTQGTVQMLWLGRRLVTGITAGPWEMFNTGSEFTRGDENSWDAHNVIALGICHTDGSLHFSWDHHGHTLRYRRSIPGLCTTNLAAWGPSAINPEQNWLVTAGQSINTVTYPRFVNTPSGELCFFYRTGSTSAGDHWWHNYLPGAGAWTAGRKFSAKEGVFSDVSLNGGTFTSSSRNAYENDYAFGPDGTLHYTWTYREATANPSNHDIHYACSSDGGVTWRNNVGTVIADTSAGEAIRVDSPGIIVKVINSRQRLINQQGACVDNEGRVHVLMLHRRVEPGFEWQLGDSAFSTADTAYYHYFRDPVSGVWSQRRLPVDVSVGSRPKIAFDAQGNVYAVYLGGYTSDRVPGYNSGRLIIASASRQSQYTDWAIVQVIDLALNGEPLVDQKRLLEHNILSVFIQENSAVTTVVGTPLHVFDFAVNVQTPAPLSVNFNAQDVLIVLPSEAGYSYQLRTTDSLSADWVNVGAAISGTGSLIALPHPNGRNNFQQFYSVIRNAH